MSTLLQAPTANRKSTSSFQVRSRFPYSVFYCSADWAEGTLCNGWTYNHAKNALLTRDGPNYLIIASEATGGAVNYSGLGKIRKGRTQQKTDYYSTPGQTMHADQRFSVWHKGMTNTGAGEISGRTNLKNQNAVFVPSKHERDERITVSTSTGGERTFKRFDTKRWGSVFNYSDELPVAFQVTKDRRPNGNQLHYGYVDGGARMGFIHALNPAGSTVFGSLIFDYSECRLPNLKMTVRASDGREVIYKFKNTASDRWYLTEVTRPNNPKVTYEYLPYEKLQSTEKVCCKTGADGRFQQIDYYLPGENWVGDTSINIEPATVRDMRRCRVRQLKAPVGTDDSAIVTARFFYSFDYVSSTGIDYHYGLTDVRDAYNHRTLYRFSGDRLQGIERYLGNSETTYERYSSDKLFWGEERHNQHTDLICRAFLEADDRVRSCRFLEYDIHHNVVAEHVLGNLSGENEIPPIVNETGIPADNGCERYTVRRTYSATPIHLLQSELLPNGRMTTMHYWQQTDLPAAKLVSCNGQVLMREFHEYDNNRALTKTIVDNGTSQSSDDLTGVTQRKITYVTPRVEAPCIGLPAIIEERYLDIATGAEKLLGKQINTYSIEGRLTERQQYDCNNELRYTLRWEYDALGNVILEQNAIGQVIERRFDANGNKIFEKGPSRNFHMEYVYDYFNRLVAEERVCQDGIRFKQSYRYDYLGNRIVSVDIYGNETRYDYDEFSRLVRTTLPPCAGTSLQTQQEYDIAGNVVSEIDVHGNVTRKRYNIRGQPVHVEYADGSHESCEYNLDGSLHKQIAKNGSQTLLSYDVLGNVVRKEVHSSQGDLLAVTTSTYHGGLLTSETDANGNLTSYSYDGAGRPVMVSRPAGWTRYEYDNQGRKHKVCEWTGPGEDDVRVTFTEFDLLGRVIEQRVEDQHGFRFSRVQSQYDETGNVSAVTTDLETGPATSRSLYNAQGLPWKVIDAAGNETLTHYHYGHRNEWDQRVLQVTLIDPLGNQTVTTKDTLGRSVSILRKDIIGQETAKALMEYDGTGQLIRRVDIVKTAGAPDRHSITEWQYDKVGRLVTLFEATKTPQCRQTFYNYDTLGQKDTDIFADGSTLKYEYDALGRLARYAANDGSLAYRYTYDANSNIIEVVDEVLGTSTKRQYDASNRMIAETLANGLTMTYQYDGLGRVTTLGLPDSSGVNYHYSAGHLKQVSRVDKTGSALYSHHYLSHDQAGNVTFAQLIGLAGTMTYSWDKLSRLQNMKTLHFEEEIPANGYDAAGNLLAKRRRDSQGETNYQYTFDALYQLTSEQGPSNHQYAYDSLNNRINKDGQTCDIDPLNQLTRQGDSRYNYDARGSRVAQTINGLSYTYAYDTLGRLTTVQVEDRKWEYHYDAFNRRISKICCDASGNIIDEERYLYHDQVEIGAVDKDGTIKQFRMLGRGLGAEIGAAVAIELGANLFAPLHDHSGHVVALVNPVNGEIVHNYHYTAFGEERRHQQSWLWGLYDPTGPSGNPWRFSSKRHDPETGWYYFGRRFYDPHTARWATTDPRGYDDGPNLYAYVHNSPLTHIDLFGLYTTRCSHCGRTRDYDGPPRPSWSDKWSRIRNTVSHARAWIGDRMADVGYNLVPIEPIQRGWIATCRGLGGSGYNVPEHYFRPSGVWRYEGTAQNQDSRAIPIYINGICNFFNNAWDNAAAVSKIHKGSDVLMAYNSSRGFVSDILETVAQIVGIPTRSVDVCRQVVEHASHLVGGPGGDGFIFVHAHSQAGALLNRAMQFMDAQTIGMLEILGSGSAKMISDGRAASSRIVNHRSDLVPFIADPIGYCAARFFGKGNTTWVGGAFCRPDRAHEFQNDEQLKAMERVVSDIYDRRRSM